MSGHEAKLSPRSLRSSVERRSRGRTSGRPHLAACTAGTGSPAPRMLRTRRRRRRPPGSHVRTSGSPSLPRDPPRHSTPRRGGAGRPLGRSLRPRTETVADLLRLSAPIGVYRRRQVPNPPLFLVLVSESPSGRDPPRSPGPGRALPVQAGGEESKGRAARNPPKFRHPGAGVCTPAAFA